MELEYENVYWKYYIRQMSEVKCINFLAFRFLHIKLGD